MGVNISQFRVRAMKILAFSTKIETYIITHSEIELRMIVDKQKLLCQLNKSCRLKSNVSHY